jgi:hypothetical protein
VVAVDQRADPRFAHEALARGLVARELGRHHLERALSPVLSCSTTYTDPMPPARSGRTTRKSLPKTEPGSSWVTA